MALQNSRDWQFSSHWLLHVPTLKGTQSVTTPVLLYVVSAGASRSADNRGASHVMVIKGSR